MSFEMMKKAMISAVGAIALMGAVNAHAGDPFVTDPAAGDGQSYTFEGTTSLSYLGITATCDLKLTGYTDASAGTITITSNQVTGPYPCSGVSISNLTVGQTSNITSTGGDVTFSGVDVVISGLFQCNNGDVTAHFSNDGIAPSYFTIPSQGFGFCTLETVPNGDLIIIPSESYSSDINIQP